MENFRKDSVKLSLQERLKYFPKDWFELTTHRLDIYNEDKAKVQFLDKFDALVTDDNLSHRELENALLDLPTAYDYIRLGHPLSCILEWAVAKENHLNPELIISFSSQVMPLLAILRKNLFDKKQTLIVGKDLPLCFDKDVLKLTYGYDFELADDLQEVLRSDFVGSKILVKKVDSVWNLKVEEGYDFVLGFHDTLGSIILVSQESSDYVSEIQHVRRRESIAMTPQNCLAVLQEDVEFEKEKIESDLAILQKSIKEITLSNIDAAIGSSGLSIQYAIMMGLIASTQEKFPDKKIHFIVPPNCYGGTNDQARRVASCNPSISIVDLPVDSGQDMAESLEKILGEIANSDGVPFIIAEIPTNPRVEVPQMDKLQQTLEKDRYNSSDSLAIKPVFVLDQTFCPNIRFFEQDGYFSNTKTISYVSGSKFPSGGLCTAGYCVANKKAEHLMNYIDRQLKLCGNIATAYQVETLKNQIPSMNQRIEDAYKNTREFVKFIQEILPSSKVNFVSNGLALEGFTPSVFSLDLPTVGKNKSEREIYKRELNLKLINSMITNIPHESKHCVSYGQLKGCYWTIPATSTQGTTKEGDKDYIVRVAVSPSLNLDLHKEVFLEFCKREIFSELA